MRIYLQELKKIFRPAPVLVVIAAAAVFGYILSWQYDWLNTVHMSSDYIRLAAELKEEIGDDLTQESYDAAVETLIRRHKAALMQCVRGNPVFAEIGVTDFDSFLAFRSKAAYSLCSEEARREFETGAVSLGGMFNPYDPGLDYTLTDREESVARELEWGEIVNFECQKLDYIYANFINAWTNRLAFAARLDDYLVRWYSFVAEDGRGRIARIVRDGETMDILPADSFLYDTARTFLYLSLFLTLSVSVLIAPVLTRDNMSGVRTIQYASRQGRRTLAVQLAACLTSSVLLAAAGIGVTFPVFLGGCWKWFLDSGMNGFILPPDYNYFWFTGTFGQWLASSALLIFVLSAAVSLIVFVISKVSRTYISLLLALIPTLAAVVFLSFQVFVMPFGIVFTGYRVLYNYLPIPYVEAAVTGFLFLAGAVSAGIAVKRELRADVAQDAV